MYDGESDIRGTMYINILDDFYSLLLESCYANKMLAQEFHHLHSLLTGDSVAAAIFEDTVKNTLNFVNLI